MAPVLIDPNRRAILRFSAASLGLSFFPPAMSVNSAPSWRLIGGLVSPLSEPGSELALKVGRLLEGSGHHVSPIWLPWARAYREAKLSGDCLLFPLVRTAEREHEWQWLAPLAVNKLVLLVRKDITADAPASLTPSHLHSLRVGVLHGSFLVEGLRRDGFEKIDVATSEISNIRKLARGRIDAWATMQSVATAPELQSELAQVGLHSTTLIGALSMWLAASNDLKLCNRPAGQVSLEPSIDKQCIQTIP